MTEQMRSSTAAALAPFFVADFAAERRLTRTMTTTAAARVQRIRNHLKATLEATAPRPAAFFAASTRLLGPADEADVEALRSAVLEGGAWLPRLALRPDASDRNVRLSRDGQTVIVHTDWAHDEARISQLYRQALAPVLLPPRRPGWLARVSGWLRAPHSSTTSSPSSTSAT